MLLREFDLWYQADYGDGTFVWELIEYVFLTIFTAELCLNLFAFGDIFWEVMISWLIFLYFPPPRTSGIGLMQASLFYVW